MTPSTHKTPMKSIEKVVIPVDVALDVLEKLRVASMWLGPKPEDWKPEKWPEYLAEEFGIECLNEFRRLLALMEEQLNPAALEAPDER